MPQFFTCYILGGNKLFDKLSDTTKKRKEKQEAKVKEVAALFLKGEMKQKLNQERNLVFQYQCSKYYRNIARKLLKCRVQ